MTTTGSGEYARRTRGFLILSFICNEIWRMAGALLFNAASYARGIALITHWRHSIMSVDFMDKSAIPFHARVSGLARAKIKHFRTGAFSSAAIATVDDKFFHF